MSGMWLTTYVVLWILVLVQGFLLVGALQQVGLLRRRIGLQAGATEDAVDSDDLPPPPLEEDGPAIGTGMPDVQLETINHFGTLSRAALLSGVDSLLIVFMSPLCEGCQHAVAPLNKLVAERATNGHRIRVVAILRADEQACRSFLSVFPLEMAIVSDGDRSHTRGFGVHRNPFGLLYDAQGTLMRKGLVVGAEDLRALCASDDEPDAIPVSDRIYPPRGAHPTSLASPSFLPTS